MMRLRLRKLRRFVEPGAELDPSALRSALVDTAEQFARALRTESDLGIEESMIYGHDDVEDGRKAVVPYFGFYLAPRHDKNSGSEKDQCRNDRFYLPLPGLFLMSF